MKSRQQYHTLLYAIFTVSGFTGLIYESIWTHYLKLFLGHAAYAQAIVLSIFMGGLAIGAWMCSRFAHRIARPLLAYALAEAIIGVFALCFHPGFDRLTLFSQTHVFPAIGDPNLVKLIKWSLAALMILPQSILLGMTFPLMTSGIVRTDSGQQGKILATLYFLNSAGAAVGVLVSGFMLVNMLGLPGSLTLAGILNILIGLLVWRTTSSEVNEPLKAASNIDLAAREITGRSSKSLYATMLMISLLTGVASFIYEIGWIRMLSLVLGSSTHSFELMLSAFIIGIALGSLYVRSRMTGMENPWRFLAFIQVVMGCCACLTVIYYMKLFDLMGWLVLHLPKTDQGYLLFNIAGHSLALLLMLPTTFCAGMTLPLITTALLRAGCGEKSIGAVYGANTLGAIMGVVFALFAGMPFLGIKGLILSGAALDMALGIALLWRYHTGIRKNLTPVAVTTACALIIAVCWKFIDFDPLKLASGIFRYGKPLKQGSDTVLFHEDGKTATVSVVMHENRLVSIRTNGKSDSALSTGALPSEDEATMTLLAVLPLMYHPKARNSAVIGFGTGFTSTIMLEDDRLASVDTVEIEENIVKGANYFRPPVEKVYSNTRSHIIIDDAKTYFSTHNKKYGIIVSEPSNPWVSGTSGLFTAEFYRLLKRHLTEDGVFVQWLQLYEIDDQSIISVLKTIDLNFGDYAIYLSPNNFDILIVASPKRPLPDISEFTIRSKVIKDELSRIGISDINGLKRCLIARKSSITIPLTTNPLPINSDYYPFLDQHAVRARFLDKTGNKTLNYINTNPSLLTRITD